MKNFTKLATVLLMTGLASGPALAKDIYVYASGDDGNDGLTPATAVKTLGRVNEIIAKGDIVHVSGMIDVSVEKPETAVEENKWSDGGKWASTGSGKYQGFNISSRDNTQWQGITFIGEDPIKDGFTGSEKTPLFIIRGKNNDGTKFKNIGFIDGISNINGGTLVFRDEAVVNFENCHFVNNHPDWTGYTLDGNLWKAPASTSEKGGAIRSEGNCMLTFNGCLFEKNINRQGGAIYLSGTAKDRTRSGWVSLNDCVFRNNTVEGCVDNNERNILDNTKGAAIAVYALNNEVYLEIDHCLFENNKTWNEGGAIWIYDNTAYGHYCDITIANSAFYCNESRNNNGGAINITHASKLFEDKDYVTTQKIKIVNTTFSQNQAKNHGGAICFNGAATNLSYPSFPKTELWMVNCTVVGNYTSGNGGHCAGYKEMNNGDDCKIEYANRHFYNCIFEGNIAQNSGTKKEASDFNSAYINGIDIANTYIGRLYVPNMPVDEYVESIDAQDVKYCYSDNNIEEGSADKFYVANNEDALYTYNYTSYYDVIVPFIPLSADSELRTAGSTKWLAMEDSEVINPVEGKASKHPCLGYDITKFDQLGFPRKGDTGSCAIGASEATVDYIMKNYFDGKNELPYKNGDMSGIEDTFNAPSMTILRNGDDFIAEGANISVYSVSGLKVTEGNGRVNISNLSNGIYIVRAQSAEKSGVVKIIK